MGFEGSNVGETLWSSSQARFFLKSAPVSLWLNLRVTLGKVSRASSSRLFKPARSTAWIALSTCQLNVIKILFEEKRTLP